MISHFFLFLMTTLCLYSSSINAQIWERELLITGCARSGTGYIAKVLTLAGFNIDHERIGKRGASAWPMAVLAEKAPWGPSPVCTKFTHIFHQVRHPVRVISSVYTSEPKRSWEYIMAYIPEINKDDIHLVKCAKYWYYWNLKAAERAEWTYRIEDIDNVWDEMAARLGVTLDRSALEQVSRTTNRREGGHKSFTWKTLEENLDTDLLYKVQSLAVSYGYSLDYP